MITPWKIIEWAYLQCVWIYTYTKYRLHQYTASSLWIFYGFSVLKFSILARFLFKITIKVHMISLLYCKRTYMYACMYVDTFNTFIRQRLYTQSIYWHLTLTRYFTVFVYHLTSSGITEIDRNIRACNFWVVYTQISSIYTYKIKYT